MAFNNPNINIKIRTVKPVSATGFLSGFIGLISMSIIAGILITVGLTPAIAATGSIAASGIGLFESLPDYINPKQLSLPSHIYAKDSSGNRVELAQFYAQNRILKGWDDISQFAKDAAVAGEDRRFFEHSGVDLKSITRAAIGNAKGAQTSGASTITMQYAKNILVQQAELIPDEKKRKAEYEEATRQDLDRKLKEMRLAMSLEKKFSKNDILLGYLNIANFGGRVYGIEAAAKRYFNVSAKDLSLPQAASLIATVNAPGVLNLSDPQNFKANKERRDFILDSMLETGKITQEQHDKAVATPITTTLTSPDTGCQVANSRGLGHFCNFVVLYILNDPKFGATQEERYYNFQHGGLNIDTTVDLDMQAAGTDIMSKVPARTSSIDLGVSAVSVEASTGRVLAMVQNRSFSDNPEDLAADPNLTSINYGTDYEYGGSSGFQSGSTVKAFTLAEWFREGHSAKEIVPFQSRTFNLHDFKGECFDGGAYGYGSFRVLNHDNQGAAGSVQTATDHSVNAAYASMAQKLDLCKIFDVAETMGLRRAAVQSSNQELSNFGTTNLSRVPSGAYNGNDEVSPIRIASAFAGFVNNGTTCTPVPIDKITNVSGNDVDYTKSECKKSLDSEIAKAVTKSLESVVQHGTATVGISRTGIPHYAKTGTTDNTVDHWLSGGSSKVITSAWSGNVTGKVSLSNNYTAYSAPFNLWAEIMNIADRKYGGSKFPEANLSLNAVSSVNVPNVVGQSLQQAENTLIAAGLNPKIGDVPGSTSKPTSIVTKTDPAPGTQVSSGAEITITTDASGDPNKKPIPGGLTGRTAAEAGSTLRSAGFNQIFMACNSGGTPSSGQRVLSTNPAEGTPAKPEDKVTLTVECH